MFAILYEANSSGFYLGMDNNLESAENRFRRITDDLLENISNGKTNNSENFFEMYGIFNIVIFCTDYECYKIITHKVKILTSPLSSIIEVGMDMIWYISKHHSILKFLNTVVGIVVYLLISFVFDI